MTAGSTTTPPTDVAILIPAYQAKASIADIVRRSLGQMPNVLVVDDGSTDGTSTAAREAGAQVLRLDRNQGKGDALEAGFAHLFALGFQRVVTLDADGQHLPEQVPVLLSAAVGGADLVLGSRAHLFTEMSRLRRVANSISSRAISFAAGRPLVDIQTGFRLYHRRLIETLGLPEARFEAESAVVVRAARRGFDIVTVPIELGFADGRSTSHFRPIVDSLRIAGAVVRARFSRARSAVADAST